MTETLGMEGRRPQLGESASFERRDREVLRLSLDPAPGRLRETLAEIDRAIGYLEPPSMRRLRLILTELLGRSGKSEQIHVDVLVLTSAVRIEVWGAALALPDDPTEAPADDPSANPSFPPWVLMDLADRWGIDRRRSERAIWLLFDRPSPR